jgi:hypothetical protein
VSKHSKKPCIFVDRGRLIALTFAAGMLLGIVGPASAQFFDFGGFQQRPHPQRGGGYGGGWFGNDVFAPFQQPAPQRRWDRRQTLPPERDDFSRAPPPEKHETVPQRHILVLGDAMADWLAYGLEDLYSEQPDIGVTRKHKTVSGLLSYLPKGDPADWTAAAKSILATENPEAIVVMLGLNDRVAIREPAGDKSDSRSSDKSERKDAKAKPDRNSSDAKSAGHSEAVGKPDDKGKDSELSPDEPADNGSAPPLIEPERTARSSNGFYEFHQDGWAELYRKKIEEMIGVLKSKGVPVLWVGLPVVRGTKATADTLFLDSLYRDAAGKAGINYVDVWDGFVDEAGHFMQKGPDLEGQIRQLRSYDGVYFTKAGARKLAHYVEREITRLLAARSAPIALPAEPGTPDASVLPGRPLRPLAGPIVPLVASPAAADQLLGAPGSRPVAIDALAARVLVNGEPLAAPAGRADDFAWPRREIGRERAVGETPMVSALPKTVRDSKATMPAPSLKPKKNRRVR